MNSNRKSLYLAVALASMLGLGQHSRTSSPTVRPVAIDQNAIDRAEAKRRRRRERNLRAKS